MDDARVAVSRDARESMLRWLRPKTEVVDHGIAIDALPDRADSRRRIRDELALGEEVILVVTVANYRVHKDYPNLLNAFRRLVDRAEVPVHLAVVGRGPLEAEIRELVDTLDLAAAVTLLGYRADATAVIAAADIFTLASRQEGRPVALMEALALGCPVVVTAAGGIPEMVEDGREGRIVRVEHSGELADALLALVASSGERARFAVAAAVRGQGFDITLAQRALEQIYSRVVKSRQAS
jgi:glycosyltransferase involved in cell wall biosynthesis